MFQARKLNSTDRSHVTPTIRIGVGPVVAVPAAHANQIFMAEMAAETHPLRSALPIAAGLAVLGAIALGVLWYWLLVNSTTWPYPI
jgi:hypothetical protein